MPEEGEFLTYFVKNYLFYNYYETNQNMDMKNTSISIQNKTQVC